MESEGESEPEQQPPKEKMGEKKLLNSRSCITSSSAHHHSQPPQPSLSRQSLCRRVNAVVMGVIIPIGKQRKGLNRNRICFGGNGPSSDKLPRFVYCFVLSYFHKRQEQAAQVCVLFLGPLVFCPISTNARTFTWADESTACEQEGVICLHGAGRNEEDCALDDAGLSQDVHTRGQGGFSYVAPGAVG